MLKMSLSIFTLMSTLFFSLNSYADSTAIINCANQRLEAQGFAPGMQNRFNLNTFAGKEFDRHLRDCMQRMGSLEDKIQSPNQPEVLPAGYEDIEPEYSEDPTIAI